MSIRKVKMATAMLIERDGNFLLSPASAGEVHNSIFDWTVSVTRNDFLVSSEPYVGILI